MSKDETSKVMMALVEAYGNPDLDEVHRAIGNLLTLDVHKMVLWYVRANTRFYVLVARLRLSRWIRPLW